MNETHWEPQFLAVEVTPNPAYQDKPLRLRVIVTDVFGKAQIEARSCGEIYCGEV